MVALRRFGRLAMLGASLALAACAGQTPAVVAPPTTTSQAAPESIYKVGTPYQVEGIWYYPAEDYAYAQEGVASWYGTDFHGKRTANGDRYDMNALTAAHPTLPMPSVVKITNLENGTSLKVTVNDRGPFHSKRIIDVSKRAAQLLGFYDKGTARVRVEIDPEESLTLKNIAMAKRPPQMPQIAAAPRAVVSALALPPPPGGSVSVPAGAIQPVSVPPPAPVKPATPAGSGIFVQAGAFSEEANARRLEQQLGELGPVHIVPTTVNKKKLYRVRLGPVADAGAATALMNKIRGYGYNDVKVVRE